MITKLFLGFALLGAQWVLWLLVLISVVSFAIMLERGWHFRTASRTLEREIIRAMQGLPIAVRAGEGHYLVESLLADARLSAERRLNWLASIGANAPFVGLFGTVLGIIRAFHDLSRQGTQGSAIVSAGISEALVATAVGLLVAIPSVVAYNHFQRQVREMLLVAERTRNSLVAQDLSLRGA
jgi:biopolymer transport protein ExbB